jgi:hypothetical protein
MVRHCGSIPMPRILHYFPIVHTAADFGTFGESALRAKAAAIGRRGALLDAVRIDRLWREIETASDRIPIPSGRLRVYQDGLPVCDRVERIVKDLAGAGSANHRILLKLEARGAVLMGTEEPDLLVEEYNLAPKAIGAKRTGRAGVTPRGSPLEADTLLDRRDRFIASRINATLEPGEAGILFIGALHAVAPYLNPDIQVIYPLYRPSAAVPRDGEPKRREHDSHCR